MKHVHEIEIIIREKLKRIFPSNTRFISIPVILKLSMDNGVIDEKQLHERFKRTSIAAIDYYCTNDWRFAYPISNSNKVLIHNIKTDKEKKFATGNEARNFVREEFAKKAVEMTKELFPEYFANYHIAAPINM